MKPHKIKIVAGDASAYSIAAVCEYCGVVAFYGNMSAKTIDQDIGGCKNSPDYKYIIGDEIMSMISRIGKNKDNE